IALKGGTDSPVDLAAQGGLIDPDGSGKLYLNELLADPAGSVKVGFGKFANPNLTGAFASFAKGDKLGSFGLALNFLDADTFGINLGGEVAKIAIDVKVKDVTGAIPSLDADVNVDTAALPNFSDILSSFKNLSIPQMISLVAGLVTQFKDFPLFKTQ